MKVEGLNERRHELPAARLELPPRLEQHRPIRLFERAKHEGRTLKIAAPMVRYSKLPFRELCRDYGTDVCYTPMILAKEFIRSNLARDMDFSSSSTDRPLIVQFGASNELDFARAAELVKPYCDGVDLNCGCPQTWAFGEGIGCKLMSYPELVRDMVKAAKERCGEEFSVSVKIRIHLNLQETVQWVKTVESARPDYITVHGRRKTQRSSEPVNIEAVKLIKSIATVPVVLNGDVFSMGDVDRLVEATGVDGVMAARGLMTNPALFAGYNKTPWGAVERFLDYNMRSPLPFRFTLHHVSEIMESMLPRRERTQMIDSCKSIIELIDWLDQRFVLRRKGEEEFGERIEVERRIIHSK
ncbi:tRNA-dihydrouridine synthase [Terfezia boudieri ATCC MYA-4762]|uniref:tRNA-dihydrouridine(20a/20b) synthase [NAD(P)+] n=1 Tax=Terfezia boudieri ATCC MYA-4762 TaxID=1051890 RepID=A0A3N4LK66_9PEZI|nr:tRNA-dihydrouridine synthase [Terfezia boudieri ATCC MYA-4762]